MLRVPVTALSLLALLGPREGAIELSPNYREGQVFVVEETGSSEEKTADVTVKFNGEELDVGDAEADFFGEPATEESELTTRDEVLAVDDGRIVRMRRSFETVHREGVDEMGEEFDDDSVLEGRSLILIEDEDGEVVAEVDDDDELEAAFLEGHDLRYSIEYLLPDGPVEPGDSWELDEETIEAYAHLDAGPELFDGDGSEADDDALMEAMDEVFDVTVEVTFTGVVERDGIECALLDYTMTLQAALDEVDPELIGFDADELGFPFPVEPVVRFEFDGEGEGRAWFAVEGGHPVAAEESLSGELAGSMVLEDADAGMAIEFAFTQAIEYVSETRWTLE